LPELKPSPEPAPVEAKEPELALDPEPELALETEPKPSPEPMPAETKEPELAPEPELAAVPEHEPMPSSVTALESQPDVSEGSIEQKPPNLPLAQRAGSPAIIEKDDETTAAIELLLQETLGERPQLTLFSATTLVNGKRPVLSINDALEDPEQLSSRKVKRCQWTANVLLCLVGKVCTLNGAACALRNAVAVKKGAVSGSSGVNAKLALAVDPDGKKCLKTAINNQELAALIAGGEPAGTTA